MAKKPRPAAPARNARDREIRVVAATLRAGEKPDVGERLLRLAETRLRNRAVYNQRRAAVRAIAAEIRKGKETVVPPELKLAVEKHLEYREAYNAERVAQRAATKRRRGPTTQRG